MMSLSQINALSAEIARKAKRQHREPYLVPAVPGSINRINAWEQSACPFPNLGDYRPAGWELTETYFVDKTGWGRPGELALTIGAFCETLRNNVRRGLELGYAIIEEGECQVVIAGFKRVE